MALSDRERHILGEIERGLLCDEPDIFSREHARHDALANVRILLAGLLGVIIIGALIYSEAAGLTLLIACGLLGGIGYLHRYNVRHPG